MTDVNKTTDDGGPVTDKEPKIFLKFRASQKSPALDIQNGEYHRLFKADEQPFEVADAEEERLLRNTGYFVSDKEAEAEAEAAQEQGQSADGTSEPGAVATGSGVKSQSPKPKVEGKIGGAPAGAE